MKKNAFLFFIVIFLVLSANEHRAHSQDKYSLLMQGNIARDEGRLDVAVESYVKYIESHPALRGFTSMKYRSSEQYYLRNLLIAYSNLLDVHRRLGADSKVTERIRQIKQVLPPEHLGAKNRYRLGALLSEFRNYDDAILLFEKILAEQLRDFRQGNNKVVLRTASTLMGIYQESGNKKRISAILQILTQNKSRFNFDVNDQYRLASLYLTYGMDSKGVALLEGIVKRGDATQFHAWPDAYIRAFTKLGKYYGNHDRKDKQRELADYVAQTVDLRRLSSYHQYKVALMHVNAGKTTRCIDILKQTSERNPDSLWGKKSLFLLGRISQSEEKWDNSIHYFSEYIQRYPEPPFFAIKAYASLLDSQWAKGGDLALIEEETQKLCDIVNEICDYEIQLNTARDLKRKGLADLADATFVLGLTRAKKIISETEDPFVRLRTKWVLGKYASAMERYDVFDECAEPFLSKSYAVQKELQERLNKEQRKRVAYFKSQTYLTKANIEMVRMNHDEAEVYFKRFISEFPDDKDVNYARFNLGNILNERRKHIESRAAYQSVDAGMWKEKARAMLMRQDYGGEA